MEAATRRGRRVIGEAAPNNLPRYLTSFVGRRTDLIALKSVLTRSRMVTLVGPGGGGKSRLAAELCRARLDRWADGVWWVELAPVNDPRQVAGAVVSALELPGRGPALDVLIAWLAARRALLVLDNCEHLVAACADFCQAALEHCPELTIITTSREALGVAGEAHWPVSSLRSSDAVRLFEVRAALVRPGFEVAAANLNPVTEICEHLDRLPLAIELAAARMGMMTDQEILGQLADRFHLLTGGSRTAPERLQAMSAAIDWSYRLLTEEEALLFRRLSVFRGGFTLDSAEAVCADGMTARVLDLIAGLVQKSMVVAEPTNGSGSRYRLLESQLAYAEERLRKAGDFEHVARRHYEYFQDCLSVRTDHPAQPQPPHGVAESEWIGRELSNLWAAMRWAQKNADDLGLSLAGDLALVKFGDMRQARRLLAEVLDHSPDHGVSRFYALRSAARLAWHQGDPEAAVFHAEACLATARDLGDPETIALALITAGVAHSLHAEFGAAGDMFEEATLLLKGSSNRPLVALLMNDVAVLEIEGRGNYGDARDIFAECLATARADGDVWGIAQALDGIGWAEVGLNDHNAAAASFKAALAGFRSFLDHRSIIDCLGGLLWAAEAAGDDIRAVRLAAAASRMSGEWSLRADPWLLRRAEDAQGRSRSRLGACQSEKAWNEGWAMSFDGALDYALDHSDPKTDVEVGPLSRREREVARLVAAGMTNRQIGERLFISWRTAGGHVERIRNKLGVRSRTEVATWAVERGLMTDHLAVERGTSKKTGSRGGPTSPRR
jgi:predicted ATPase/DNA-binding CsgD family transcriptional regulator